jgi:hypothetical protein
MAAPEGATAEKEEIPTSFRFSGVTSLRRPSLLIRATEIAVHRIRVCAVGNPRRNRHVGTTWRASWSVPPSPGMGAQGSCGRAAQHFPCRRRLLEGEGMQPIRPIRITWPEAPSVCPDLFVHSVFPHCTWWAFNVHQRTLKRSSHNSHAGCRSYRSRQRDREEEQFHVIFHTLCRSS